MSDAITLFEAAYVPATGATVSCLFYMLIEKPWHIMNHHDCVSWLSLIYTRIKAMTTLMVCEAATPVWPRAIELRFLSVCVSQCPHVAPSLLML